MSNYNSIDEQLTTWLNDDEKYEYQERAAIHEFEAGLSTKDSANLAYLQVTKQIILETKMTEEQIEQAAQTKAPEPPKKESDLMVLAGLKLMTSKTGTKYWKGKDGDGDEYFIFRNHQAKDGEPEYNLMVKFAKPIAQQHPDMNGEDIPF